jgi:hypothetical protein
VLDVSKAAFRIIETAPAKSQIPVGRLLNEKDEKLSLYLQKRMLRILVLFFLY